MSDAVVTVLSFAVVLTTLTTLLGAALGSNAKSTEAWVYEARAAQTQALGGIRAVAVTTQDSAGTTVIEVTLENTGSLSYSDWGKWDVSVQYTTATGGTSLQRMANASTLAAGKWIVQGIYLDATTRAETGVDPDVFDPSEQLLLRLQVSPLVGSSTTGLVVITTQDGLSTRIHFDT